MQLVAYGAQDIYLTGNPQITFFKVVYRRHTNFAIESIENTYSGNFEFGQEINATIGRNGDLLGNITLEMDLGLNYNDFYLNSPDQVGDIKISTKTEDFEGWLLCDGRIVSKYLYYRLFERIGYAFGGSGEFFRLPDLRNKVIGFTNTTYDASANRTIGNVYDIVSVDETSDIITVPTNTDKWITGMEITFSSTGSLPQDGGGDLNGSYFVIRISDTEIKIAENLTNALGYVSNSGEYPAIDITTPGTGTITIIHTLTSRAMGNGSGEEKHGLTIPELAEHNHGTNYIEGLETIDYPDASGQIARDNQTSLYIHSHRENREDSSGGLTMLDGSHNHTGTTDINGFHNHTFTAYDAGSATSDAGRATSDLGARTITTSGAGSHSHTFTTNHVPDHTHEIFTDYHRHTINPAGEFLYHNNMQPTLFTGSAFIYAGIENDIEKCACYLKDHLIRWGFQLIDYIDVEIGGQLIDRHYGEWLDIWTQLTYTREKYDELLTMVNTSLFSSHTSTGYDKIAKVYVPLQFWFNRNPGLYLPLIALQYHEVKLKVVFNSKETVNTATQITTNVVSINDFNFNNGSYTKSNYIESLLTLNIFCDFVFLDTDERRRFAQVSHEYLIEQVQNGNEYTNSGKQNIQLPLYFNHPCKFILWRGRKTNFTVQDNGTEGSTPYNNKFFLSQLYDYTTLGGNSSESSLLYYLNPDIVKTAKLQLNGHDRIKERDGTYFRVVQPNMYISPPNSNLAFYHNSLKQYGGGFYMYTFGLRVDEHQPSGTCNFSRLDNANLLLTLNPYASSVEENKINIYDYNFRVFAVNYNILRIVAGMGGLAYSN